MSAALVLAAAMIVAVLLRHADLDTAPTMALTDNPATELRPAIAATA